MSPELAVALAVAAALEADGVRYLVGGSLASSQAGEPRSTPDIDLVAELDARSASALAKQLQADFYVDGESVQAAVRAGSSFNVIHEASGVKVDIFVAHSRLDRMQMDRRRLVPVDEGQALYFYTPEDILLQKLLWYRAGGEISDRQWRDVVGIVRVQGERLDRAYLRTQAQELGLVDLLEGGLAEGSEK